jgi:hypothetical protein
MIKSGSKSNFYPKFTKTVDSAHTDLLAIPKVQYRGNDFFKRPEFRGLVLSDY